MRRRFLIALLLLAVSPARAEEIVIGLAAPLTGQNAAFGEQMRRGAAQAVADINAAGGVAGRMLRLELGDDACDPKQAVSVANQLAAKKAVFVAGHYCSSSSIPASKVYSEAGILQITPGSTNPALTDAAAAAGWNNVFRTCGRDDAQGRIAGNYLADHFKGRNVAILDDKSAYGKGLADETRKAMNAAGLKEAMAESITQGDKDFSALIAKMKRARIDAIYLGGYHTEAGLILRQAREQGLAAVLVAGDALVTNEFWNITGAAGEGTLMTFAPDTRRLPSARAVVAEFRKVNYEPEGYTLYTYAAVEAFKAAAEKSGSTDVDALSETLRRLRVDTVIGPLEWDAKGDVRNPRYVIYVWHDGTYREM